MDSTTPSKVCVTKNFEERNVDDNIFSPEMDSTWPPPKSA